MVWRVSGAGVVRRGVECGGGTPPVGPGVAPFLPPLLYQLGPGQDLFQFKLRWKQSPGPCKGGAIEPPSPAMDHIFISERISCDPK